MRKIALIIVATLALALIGCDQPKNLCYKIPVEDLSSIVVSDPSDARVNVGVMAYLFNSLNDETIRGGYIYIDMARFSSRVIGINRDTQNTFQTTGYSNTMSYMYALPLPVVRPYPLTRWPEEEQTKR